MFKLSHAVRILLAIAVCLVIYFADWEDARSLIQQWFIDGLS
ncbi:hypothetical protein [Alteromonas salexigens]|nr:hypothetical protein [Alteromonas salexigens]